jgi:hypothetical protein
LTIHSGKIWERSESTMPEGQLDFAVTRPNLPSKKSSSRCAGILRPSARARLSA